MAFDFDVLMTTEDMDTFYAQVAQHPGVNKAHAAWSLYCECGQRECFMEMFHNIFAWDLTSEWMEREDYEELFRRWDKNMPAITWDAFNDLNRRWAEDYSVVVERRFAKEAMRAWKQGPKRFISPMGYPEGAGLEIGPDNPPPHDWIDKLIEDTRLN